MRGLIKTPIIVVMVAEYTSREEKGEVRDCCNYTCPLYYSFNKCLAFGELELRNSNDLGPDSLRHPKCIEAEEESGE
jgi:hypothetical protein